MCAFGLNAKMKAYIDELKKEAKEQNPSFVDFLLKMAKYYLKAKISVKKIKNSLVLVLAAITLVKKRKISLLAKI